MTNSTDRVTSERPSTVASANDDRERQDEVCPEVGIVTGDFSSVPEKPERNTSEEGEDDTEASSHGGSAGVYAIVCKSNGKRYIGSTTDLGTRWRQHRAALRSKRHKNQHLQAAWSAYGEVSFVFEQLAACAAGELLNAEQRYIEIFRANEREFGFNTRLYVETNRGCTFSEAAKENIRRARAGKLLSYEHKLAIGRAHQGQKRPPSCGLNISWNQRGRKLTPEQALQIRSEIQLNYRHGRKRQLARKYGVSETLIGLIGRGAAHSHAEAQTEYRPELVRQGK